MEEIAKFSELLSSMEAMGSADPAATAGLDERDLETEDEETRGFMMLLTRANAGLIHKAKLRTCTAGLFAVNQYISRIPETERRSTELHNDRPSAPSPD